MSGPYHGILLDAEFDDPGFVVRFETFAKRLDAGNGWICHGVVLPAADVERVVAEVQRAMKSEAPFYAHFYDGRELIVVFKRALFRFGLDPATWEPARRYGREVLGIPADQLDFWPVRFEDEAACFSVARGRIDTADPPAAPRAAGAVQPPE